MNETGDEGFEVERVLVVDDDANYRTVVRRVLTRRGYEVYDAEDGELGLGLVEKHHPKVIILDLRMPGMDGHTFLRRLQQLQAPCSVIVTSGAGTMDDVIEVLRQGAVDYVKKPWQANELLGAVARAAEAADAHALAGGQAAVGEGAATPSPQPQTFSQVLEGIEKGTIQIPSVPTVVAELRAKLAQPNVRLPEIVELVAADQWLSAEVLRLSRSVLHGGHARGLDLRGAVTRIGLRELMSVVDTAFASRCFSVDLPELASTMQDLWAFSVARAVAMRELAPSVQSVRIESDKAYVSGLFADVGASFLVKVVGEMEKLRGAGFAVESVLELVRANHAHVGAAVLKGWGLEAVVVDLARNHHRDAAGEPVRALGALAAYYVVADGLAVDLTGTAQISKEEAEGHRRALKLSDALARDAMARARAHVADLLSLVS